VEQRTWSVAVVVVVERGVNDVYAAGYVARRVG
jgi:hypothetical protein